MGSVGFRLDASTKLHTKLDLAEFADCFFHGFLGFRRRAPPGGSVLGYSTVELVTLYA
jgi:hypothetical protein